MRVILLILAAYAFAGWNDANAKSHAGDLHPEFLEWVMGFPTGWTELKPLEMR